MTMADTWRSHEASSPGSVRAASGHVHTLVAALVSHAAIYRCRDRMRTNSRRLVSDFLREASLKLLALAIISQLARKRGQVQGLNSWGACR
jgi:hypothetical protein